MNKKIVITLTTVCLFANTMFSQENIKMMFYNVLNYPLQAPASRIQDLAVIIDDYRPDIFMICELNNEDGANNILNIMQPINANYQRAVFQPNTSDDDLGDQNDLQNMIFYDSSKFLLESQHIVTTTYRDFNHYVLKLNTVNQNTNPKYLDVFVSHLKSSSGTANQQLRLDMVNDLVAYLETLPNTSNVIFGGDLNLYTSSEPAFQELLDVTNNIAFVDPANRIGSWSNNTNYLDVFTQSTRTQTGLGGATGGFDDRFDFILTSENLLTNTDVYYVPDSYQVYGNNNNPNCYNQEINSTDCDGAEFSSTIRDALYAMSDHLPVTIELQTTEPLLNIDSLVYNNGFKIVGTNVVSDQLTLNISESNINSLAIYNALGQKVSELYIGNTSNPTIDVSKLASGIYYITTNNILIEPLKFVIR
ncbi:MAG: T9SS type A sorting domain-containing protein [Flavobacteriaceae bacterium]